MKTDRSLGTVAIMIGLVVAVVTVLVVRAAYANLESVLAIGTFVVLALTLITLMWYAFDTNSIARVTRERWSREGVLSTTYSMDLTGQKGDPGRTLFRLHNPSQLLVKATVACNLRIYGDPVEISELYDGKDVWVLFPQQNCQGWFELAALLSKKGRTVAQMMAERTPDNQKHQLTMDLSLHFQDELGATRRLPKRLHYFDFERWSWIPRLGEREGVTYDT
jgi:hypothetical protein